MIFFFLSVVSDKGDGFKQNKKILIKKSKTAQIFVLVIALFFSSLICRSHAVHLDSGVAFLD